MASFWSGFMVGLQEEDEQANARELLRMQLEEKRKDVLTSLYIDWRKNKQKTQDEDKALFQQGLSALGDKDVVGALFKSGQLESVVGVIEERNSKGTLDPSWVPSVVASVKEAYGDNLVGVGDKVVEIITGSGDLSDPAQQEASLVKALSGSAEEMEKFYLEQQQSTSIGRTQPINLPFGNQEKQDTGVAKDYSQLIQNNLAPFFEGTLNITPSGDGQTMTISMDPRADPAVATRAKLFLQSAINTLPKMVRDYQMDPTDAMEKIAEFTAYGVENNMDYTEMRSGLSQVTPESSFEFRPFTSNPTAQVGTETDVMSAIGGPLSQTPQPVEPVQPIQPVQSINEFDSEVDNYFTGRDRN